MDLYLLRHGVAEGEGAAGDAARRLTEEGAEKMRAAACGAARLGVRADALLSSPLARARETAEIVGRALALVPQVAGALAPGCDVERLLGLLAAQRGASGVVVVGHEPDFSDLIGELTGGSRVRLKKGGLALVELGALARGAGTLVWLLPPRALRQIGQGAARAVDCGQ